MSLAFRKKIKKKERTYILRWLASAFLLCGAREAFAEDPCGAPDYIYQTLAMEPNVIVPRNADEGKVLTPWVTSQEAWRACDDGLKWLVTVSSDLQVASGVKPSDETKATVYNTNVDGIGIAISASQPCVGAFDSMTWVVPETTYCDNIGKVGARSEVKIALVRLKSAAHPGLGPAGKISQGTVFDIIVSMVRSNGTNPILRNVSYSVPNIVIGSDCLIQPVPPVKLGTFGTGVFDSNRDSTTPDVDAKIQLTGCADAINTYEIDTTTNFTGSVMELDTTSSAKGIGIQFAIDKNEVLLGKQLTIDSSWKKGSNIDIPMFVHYFHKANAEVEPGTANGSVTFTVTHK
jgi:type 1 fimbria pilin